MGSEGKGSVKETGKVSKWQNWRDGIRSLLRACWAKDGL